MYVCVFVGKTCLCVLNVFFVCVVHKNIYICIILIQKPCLNIYETKTHFTLSSKKPCLKKIIQKPKTDEEGQFYRIHHDYVEHERNVMEGPRILTILIYLNHVEEGGETRFDFFGHDDDNDNKNNQNNNDDNDICIVPKVGRIVIWPSVLNDSPLDRDDRTEHEALIVRKGKKYAANIWFHLRSIVQAMERGC